MLLVGIFLEPGLRASGLIVTAALLALLAATAGIIGTLAPGPQLVQPDPAADDPDAPVVQRPIHSSDISFRVRTEPDLRFEYVSPSLTDITGYAPEELYEEPELWTQVVHPDDRTIFTDLLRDPERATDIRLLRRDGRVVHAEPAVRLILDDDGRAVGLEGVVRDITERASILAALRESEQRYRGLIEHMREGVALLDETGTIVTSNPAARRILGLTQYELHGRTDMDPRWETIHEDGSPFPGEEHPTSRTLKTGEPHYDEVLGVRTAGGKLRWVSVSSTLVDLAGNGGERGVLATFSDITERRTAQQQARERNEIFDLATSATSDVIWDWNVGTNEVWWNQQFAIKFGHDPAAAPTLEDWIDFIHPDDRERVAATFYAAIQEGGDVWTEEYRMLRADGGYSNVFDRARISRGPDGIATRMTGAMSDLTAIESAEEESREAEQRYRRLVEHIPAIAYIEVVAPSEPSGYRYVYVSPQLERILGYPPGEWLADPTFWSRVMHPDDQQRVRDATDRILSEGGPYHLEYRCLHRDGSVRWMRDIAWAVLDKDGVDSGWQGLLFDITRERRTLEEQVARRSAEAASMAKTVFLSRVSHELRTPLNAVLGFAQLLELDDLRPDQRESVTQIIRGGQHLLDLINEVIEVSRIEAGEMSMRLEPTDLANAASTAMALVAQLAEQRGISIILTEGGGAPLVSADPRRLHQILLNLLSNAVKYNRSGGHVAIGVSSDHRVAKVAVEDTGIGIDQRNLKDIFAPFERLDAPHRDIEGTGLGLSLSRGFAEAMGGALTAASELGTGSTFTLSLPLAETLEETG